METSLLSAYFANPRVGHLYQAIHMFKYLKTHNCSKIVFDPTYISLQENETQPEQTVKFKAKHMKELYPDAVELLPPNAPTPRGNLSSYMYSLMRTCW